MLLLQAISKEECMEYLDQGIADLVSLDPGEVFLGGRYMSLVPIMQQLMQGKPSWEVYFLKMPISKI